MSANDGYVYLVKLPTNTLYKIGRTQSPIDRIKGYRAGSKMLVCVLCRNYQIVERKLRNKYNSKLVKGREWFNFEMAQVREIKEFLKTVNIDKELLEKVANIRHLWETIDTFLLKIQIKQR